MTDYTYPHVWISDLGHEWLEVPYREVSHLIPQFEKFSFIKFNENKRELMVYIEGDSHAEIYLMARYGEVEHDSEYLEVFEVARSSWHCEIIEVDRLEDYLDIADRNDCRIKTDPISLSNYAKLGAVTTL